MTLVTPQPCCLATDVTSFTKSMIANLTHWSDLCTRNLIRQDIKPNSDLLSDCSTYSINYKSIVNDAFEMISACWYYTMHAHM